jgi:hypothetical protein
LQAAAALRQHTIPELKELLKAKQLRVSGSKEELIARCVSLWREGGRSFVCRAPLSAETSPLSLLGQPAPPLKAKVSKPTKAAKVAGIPDELAEQLDNIQLRKCLTNAVKELAAMVDADWHDSYEETGDRLCEYVADLEEPLSAVLKCLVAPQRTPAALSRCNDVLVEIAESWRAMSGIPFRGGHEDPIMEASINLTDAMGILLGIPEDAEGPDQDELDQYYALGRDGAISLVWTSLAAAAASSPDVDDALLLRILKDALDHGVERQEFEEEPFEEEEGAWHTVAGAKRLAAALGPAGKKALSKVASRLRAIKHYECIDRRFEGPKHLRTRNFDDFVYDLEMEEGWDD